MMVQIAMKTIVAAIDFSNASSGVLKMASELAAAMHAELKLFHAVEPEPSYTVYGFSPDEFPAMQAYQREARLRAQRQLDEMKDSIAGSVPVCCTHVTEGGALHALLEFSRDEYADLVVLGSHGHSIIAALLLGSVAEGMLRKSRIPVMMVPASPE
jgi:nucleotide-binding universal stress UspA family protein